MDFDLEKHNLLFGVRRSIRYHARRRSFFDRYDLFTNAVAVIFGSATIYAVFSSISKEWAVAAAAVVTVFSSINLVVGSSKMARLHEDLCRRFINLEKRMVEAPPQSAAELATFVASRLEIEGDEPPILKVLDSICHNELMRAMGYKKEGMLRIGYVQRFFAQFFDLGEHKIGI